MATGDLGNIFRCVRSFMEVYFPEKSQDRLYIKPGSSVHID
jgi:hypothetical protein